MANIFISVDEHVQEHPELWTKRLSRARWGDRIPHIEKNLQLAQSNGSLTGGRSPWMALRTAAQ